MCSTRCSALVVAVVTVAALVVVMLIVSFGFGASALLNLTHKQQLQLGRECREEGWGGLNVTNCRGWW